MKKQTKLVAVASAAALLAIGASMTSFAATGWVEEDGTWFYYDKDGNKVEDEWKKSGDNWYWLDSEENGAMAVDKIVEDDNNTYYVDANGVMVKNTWVKVVNEDQDDTSDPAEYRYYYMQNNGKAYKAPSDGSIKKRTIDGKKYMFDSDGKMLYGWIKDGDPTLASDFGDENTEWKSSLYYLGSWDDGAMKTGWQKINVYDAYDDESDNADKWFYFQSSGKKYKADGSESTDYLIKTINGGKYGFDEDGVMIYKWNEVTTDADATPGNWAYFRSAEEGARVTKGWFKVVPKKDFDKANNEDDEAKWYYADSNAEKGTIVTGEIKKINGKYYAFDPEFGYMLSGAVVLKTNGSKIEEVVVKSEDMDSDMMDDIKDGTKTLNADETLYFFGEEENEDTDGAMRTGNCVIKVDGTSYAVRFNTAGGAEAKGAGFTGVYKKVYYNNGLKVTAGSDDKYIFVTENSDDDGVTVEAGADLRKTDKSTEYNGTKIKYATVSGNYLVLGTNAQLKKNASGVKDGSEWYIWTDKNGKLIAYASDKDFKNTDEGKAALAAK